MGLRKNISWFWYEKKKIVFQVKIIEPNGQDFSSNIERKQLEFGFSLSISWVDRLQFPSRFLPILIWISLKRGFAISLAIFRPCAQTTQKALPHERRALIQLSKRVEKASEWAKLKGFQLTFKPLWSRLYKKWSLLSLLTRSQTRTHKQQKKKSFMVSGKRAILVETPAVLVGGRQIRETFEEPRDPLSIP